MAKCRSCRADIRWIKTRPHGRLMPIDQAPGPDGNITLDADGYGVIQNGDLFDPQTGDRYQSHFATCPNAAAHRKGWA